MRRQAILDTARDAIIGIDSSGRITLFNRVAETMSGSSCDEVVGRKVNVLMPLPYRDEHDGCLAAYRATGSPKAIGQICESLGEMLCDDGHEVLGDEAPAAIPPLASLPSSDLLVTDYDMPGKNGLRSRAR